MKKIAVIGAGESGTGAALLARKQGFDVFVSDKNRIADNYKTILSENAIVWEEGNHTESSILSAMEVVKSPGIPNTADILKKIADKKIPIISEIEFAGRYTNAKKICVTGSNGKSTTSSLIYHILKRAGKEVCLAGNIGVSFAKAVATGSFDHYVLELSSFQLDNMYEFKSDISVLLNISANHLDRYEYDIKKYAASKFRITQNQTERDYLIYNADDGLIRGEMENRKLSATKIPFSITQQLQYGAWIHDNTLQININTNPFTMSIFNLALQGKHNLYNSMAAAAVARVLDIRKDVIRECLSDFQSLEHRLEHVMAVHGIEFINDSKSTTVNSTWYALESIIKPVILILGGVDKGNDYKMLNEVVKEKVKGIVCLGTDNSKIHKAFHEMVPVIQDASSAEEAVKFAYKMGKKGDVVLLSPACASFDRFTNFEERGRKFKAAVKAL